MAEFCEVESVFMKWVNVKDELPYDAEEVMVRSKGIYNLAVFDRPSGEFKLHNGASYNIATDEVEWIRLGKSAYANF